MQSHPITEAATPHRFPEVKADTPFGRNRQLDSHAVAVPDSNPVPPVAPGAEEGADGSDGPGAADGDSEAASKAAAAAAGEALLSEGRPVTASSRGNLGPPEVVTSEKVSGAAAPSEIEAARKRP